MAARLFLLRHFKSCWNFENRFTGWVDVPLIKEKDSVKIEKIAKEIFKFKIDAIYSSLLIRNKETVIRLFDYFPDVYPIFIHLDKGKMKEWGNFNDLKKNNYIPVYVSEKLNERYYGKLQGLDKEEIIKKYGKEKVRQWRRSYDISPPYGESLKDVYFRTIPFYKKYIKKDLKEGKNILLVASHNSLRAIVKYIEKISDYDIINKEIPFGGLVLYEFDKDLKLKNINPIIIN